MQCIKDTSHSTALRDFRWYNRDSLLPPLNEAWQTTTMAVLHRPKITRTSLPFIGEQSLRLLATGEMINDEVVDGYLQLIRRKSKALVSTTTLLECFRRGSVYHPIDRTINLDNIEQVGQAFLPIYQASLKHWSFARLLYRKADSVLIVEHYDSLFDKLPLQLLDWLNQTFPGISWEPGPCSSPKQPDGSFECGPFMLMGIRLLALGSFHLVQPDADKIMPTFRTRILAELLAQSLDPTSAAHDKYIVDEEAAEQKEAGGDEKRKIELPHRRTACEPIQLDTPESVQSRGPHVNIIFSGSDTEDICSGEGGHFAIKEQSAMRTIPQTMTPDRQLKRKTFKFAISTAQLFGEPEAMIEILRGAVGVYRAGRIFQAEKEAPLLQSWHKLGGDENPQNIFWNRLARRDFSYHFYRERASVDRGPKYETRVRVYMQKVLGCEGDAQTWRAAKHQAARSSFWTELLDLFSPFEGLAYAALSAAPGSTTSLEGMTREERAVFLVQLTQRLRTPDEQLSRNLHAAGELCLALVEKKLPNEEGDIIPIERNVDLGMMSFASAVSTSMKLPLLGGGN